MALSTILLILAIVVTEFGGGFSADVEVFDKLHDESTVCNRACFKFSGSSLSACNRGCRLFSICEWVTANLTEACNECKLGCQEAYMEKTGITACSDGCDAALPIAQREHAQMAMKESQVHLAYSSPFSMFFDSRDDIFHEGFGLGSDPLFARSAPNDETVDSMWKSFFEISSLMSLLYGDDDHSQAVIIIEVAKPDINTPHPYDKKVLPNTDSGGFKTTLNDVIESNLQTNVNSKRSFVDIDFALNYPSSKAEDCYWRSTVNKVKNWWDCFTRKAGLPEFVLLIFWVSVMLILIMTYIAQFRSKPSKLSINGDLAFITDMKGELPSYIKAYPNPAPEKKSLYYIASVIKSSEEKVPLLD